MITKPLVLWYSKYTLFKGDKKYFRDGKFRDSQGVAITDDQTIIFLELTKIRKLLKKPMEELTDIECWLIFFKYAADKSKRKILNKITERKEGREERKKNRVASSCKKLQDEKHPSRCHFGRYWFAYGRNCGVIDPARTVSR